MQLRGIATVITTRIGEDWSAYYWDECEKCDFAWIDFYGQFPNTALICNKTTTFTTKPQQMEGHPVQYNNPLHVSAGSSKGGRARQMVKTRRAQKAPQIYDDRCKFHEDYMGPCKYCIRVAPTVPTRHESLVKQALLH